VPYGQVSACPETTGAKHSSISAWDASHWLAIVQWQVAALACKRRPLEYNLDG
jgi:hypothetical protein